MGYPVPKVLVLERDRSPFDGKPFVLMERALGRNLSDLISEASDHQRAELRTRFCELFVQLHTVDWRTFAPNGSDSPYFPVDSALAFVGGYLDQWPVPGFTTVEE